jgi:ribonuclease P protein component
MRDHHHLRKSSDFRRVYSARRRRDGRLLAVYSLPNQLTHARVGFAVSTKVGGAVVRNAVKRRLREVLREWLEEAGHHRLDLVIVARPEAGAAGFQELSQELKALLGGLIDVPSDDLDGAARPTPP